MELSFKIDGRVYAFDQNVFHDISIPLQFNGAQPGAFGVEQATSAAYRSGAFIGSVAQGGSCNFEKLTLVPHCNGTHTECLGHVTEFRYTVLEQLKEILVPATLISVRATAAEGETETYRPEMEDRDLVITRKSLEEALHGAEHGFLEALVIRTLPNTKEKTSRDYAKAVAPYFSVEAMGYLNELGVQHLLVDLPSLDRANDQGKLTNHHLFWGMEEGLHQAGKGSHRAKTVTEFIFAGSEVEDGRYLLNLQIAPFESDAAPSRPVLFKVRGKK